MMTKTDIKQEIKTTKVAFIMMAILISAITSLFILFKVFPVLFVIAIPVLAFLFLILKGLNKEINKLEELQRNGVKYLVKYKKG